MYSYGGGRLASSSLGSAQFCLICCAPLQIKSKSSIGSGELLTNKPVDTFIKICELLQISFLEIQQDWQFANGDGSGELPFCGDCIAGFQAVINLQQKLVEIQRRIEEKIAKIRDTIRVTSGLLRNESAKALTFRLKALGTTAEASAAAVKSPINSTSNPPSIPINSWAVTQPSTSAQHQFTTFLICDPPPALAEQPEPEPEFPPSTYSDNDQDHPDSSKSNQSSDSESEPEAPSSSSGRLQKTTRTRKNTRPPKAEHFAPIITDPDTGRITYEGIALIPSPSSGYQCGQCGTILGKDHSTSSLRKAKIHIKGVHFQAYQCHLCQRNFTTNDILNQHMRRIHEKGPVPCPTCAKPMLEHHLKKHMILHMSAQEKQAALQQGLIKLPTVKPRTLPCQICGKLFNCTKDRRRHEISHVSSKFRKDFECPHCPLKFVSPAGRKGHILVVHDTINARRKLCQICGESVIRSHYQKHMARHQGLQCKICEKQFVEEVNFKNHQKVCGVGKKRKEHYQWQCEICKKYFPSKQYMQSHRRSVHKGHWKLKVPLQLKEVVSVDNPREGNLDDLNNEGIQWVEGRIWSYQLYKLEKLEGEGGWRCCDCERRFEGVNGGKEEVEELEEQVKEHVRSVHIGDFRCNICSKRMKSLEEAVIHKRAEHARGNYRAYNCDVCGRKHMAKDEANRHWWGHMSLEEMVRRVNVGQSFPVRFKEKEWRGILEEFGVEVKIKCGICGREDFGMVKELWKHRMEEHPEAPKIRRTRGKGLKRKGGVGRDKRRKKKEVTSDTEESSGEEEEEMEEVAIKRTNGKKPGRKCKYEVPEGGSYPCPNCGKEFGELVNMRGHLYKYHREERIKEGLCKPRRGSERKWTRRRMGGETEGKKVIRVIKVICEEDMKQETMDVEEGLEGLVVKTEMDYWDEEDD